MSLTTHHLNRCIETLEIAWKYLNSTVPNSIDYEMYRNALVKGFELTLETSGKLLRKALKPYYANPREADALTYKDILRTAVKHGLMSAEQIERWFVYRDNRNNTAHDYGILFAQETIKLIPEFLKDAKDLECILRKQFNENKT